MSSNNDPNKISFGLGRTKKKNRSKTQSMLKGPVVTYASGVDRDSGNDKKQVPYQNSSPSSFTSTHPSHDNKNNYRNVYLSTSASNSAKTSSFSVNNLSSN